VSGGALLGAYYCRDPVGGLAKCVREGPLFQLVFASAIVNSWFIELALDWSLHGTDVSDVEVRFVPVATALRAGRPPAMRVVVRGTLGEAVRASGAAPVLVGPAQKHRTRYTDGGSATMIPSGVLQPYGADIVFACNSVPGPEESNPVYDFPLGSELHRFTPFGRFIDGWVSGAFLFQQVARQAAQDADVLVETRPQRAPLLEQALFVLAGCLVAASAKDPRVRAGAQLCYERWKRSW
jgi:predicted acylesterase/phospholipase RssA